MRLLALLLPALGLAATLGPPLPTPLEHARIDRLLACGALPRSEIARLELTRPARAGEVAQWLERAFGGRADSVLGRAGLVAPRAGGGTSRATLLAHISALRLPELGV